MNRDFFRPFFIIALAAILVGLIAMALPAWDNDVFPIRKMPWFSALRSRPTLVDSTAYAALKAEHVPSALDPFRHSLQAMPVAEGKKALMEHKSGPSQGRLRIAYYSDSTIEGDLITAPLRHSFQNAYGGKGVGMMPITSIVSGFRQTIRHSFSRNWESLSFMSFKKPDISLGITGYTFIPRPYYSAHVSVEEPDSTAVSADSSAVSDSLAVMEKDAVKQATTRIYVNEDPWVEYKAVDIAGGAGSFDRIRLFYSHASDSSSVQVSYEAHNPQTFRLSSGGAVNMLDISPVQPVKSVKLIFSRHDPLYVYGVSFDSRTGVFVDNYPIRGYSGMYFNRIHESVLKDFQQYLNYDLVILQYGENVSNPANKDYNNYKNAMQKTVNHIQDALPGVPILIVSAHDRSIKDASGYHTSPDIPILVKAQSELALKTGAAFFNLYEAMGGQNSMISYVQQNPPLASSDYTHFNRRGADHVAKMLLQFIVGKSDE